MTVIDYLKNIAGAIMGNNITTNEVGYNSGEEVILTSLDFLQVGRAWLPTGQQARITKYELDKQLYDGEYTNLIETELKKIYGDDEIAKMRIFKSNRFKSTLKAFEALTLGEKPDFICDNPKINDIVINQNIRALQKTALIDLMRFGQSVLKIRKDETGYKIDCISPKFWFPVVNPADIRDIQYHVIAQDYFEGQNRFLSVEIYNKLGEVKTYTCSLKGGTIGAITVEEKTISTGYKGFLVFPVGISQDSMELFNTSDFDTYRNIIINIESEITALFWRLSKQGITAYGSMDSLECDSRTGQYLFKKDNFLVLGQGEQPPGYLSFDVNAQASLDSINKLEKEYNKTSQTCPALFNEDIAQSVSSGIALKRQLQIPLQKSSDLSETLTNPFTEALKAFAVLSNQGKLDDLTIQYKDGLVNDIAEDILNSNARILGGTESKISAIMKLDGVDRETAEKKYAEIQAEQAMPVDINQGV